MSFFRTIGRHAKKKNGAATANSNTNKFPALSEQNRLQDPRQRKQNSNSQREEVPLYLTKPFCENHLVRGSFATIVVLPAFVDINEWLAINIVESFGSLNEIYGLLSEFCTTSSCPTMSAGVRLNYTWLDSQRKPSQLPAPQYINYVLQWINCRLNEKTAFPTRVNTEFPSQFPYYIRSIYEQMFRIFAHIYHAHFKQVIDFSLEAYLNSFFAHFISFGKEFRIIDRNDTQPLNNLISLFEQQKNIIP